MAIEKKQDTRPKENQEFKNFAKRLANYKEQHKETAANKGMVEVFMAAKSLSEARRLLFGEKKAVTNCSSCNQRQCGCGGRK